MNLRRLLPFLKPKPVVKYVIVEVATTDLTLNQFTADPRLTTEAAKILANAHFQVMLDVLRNESPAWWMAAGNTSPEERAFLQARGEGFMMAINTLRSMGTLNKPKEQLEADFKSDNLE